MKQLRVRKIITVQSNNEWYALFEEGNLKTPIVLMYDFELIELQKEIEIALKKD